MEGNRITGIDIIGEAPWGTHFCQFYHTKEDLLSILVPYFKAGLENNEFCMWVTSEPLSVEEAKESLKTEVKNLDDCINKGQIEIVHYSEWYKKSGGFRADRVLKGWVKKEKDALERGFDGLRLTGNTFWLEKANWRDFAEYEATIRSVIGNYKILALCSYSLDKCGSSEIIDVVSSHKFALIKRTGKWELIERAEIGQTRHKLEKAYEEVLKRQKAVLNLAEDLKKEIEVRKEAEEALRKSEEEYRVLVENASDFIYLIDDKEKVVSLNTAATELCRKEHKDLIGKSIFELFPKEIAAGYSKDLKKVFKTGRSFSSETRMIVGRKEYWISANLNPVRNSVGKVVAVLAISRDLTTRKRAEEALKESREYARNIIESSLDMIIAVNNKRRITIFNKAAQETFGYSPKEVLGTHVSLLYADVEEGRQVHQKTVKHGRHVQEISNRRKTGETFPALLSASVLCDSAGKRVGVMGVSRDITESKKSEEQIKASLREKEILLREINHRVKNNLQIISSLLSLQSEKIEDEETLKMFQESQTRVRTMALIHERLYQSSDFSHVDFSEYISSLVNELYQLYEIDPSRVAVKLEIEDISLSVSTAVPCGLIINELVTNSLKHAFTPSDKASGDGGEVESGGEVGITLRQTDENVIELIVSDNGIGIPGDIDFRNPKSLGLCLVSMLAENQLRGKIELDRSEGTKFRIIFRE